MQRLYLIGPRGSGKTTVAKRLGKLFDLPVYDTDAVVQQQAECSIAELVATSGWQAFRDLESRVLEKLSRQEGIIATGGGIVLASQNRRRMQRCGTVVYLRASAPLLVERLSLHPDPDQRPSLTELDPLVEMKAVLAERHPLYVEAAHHVIDASPCPDSVAAAIHSLLLPQAE